jgi:hypothetical protein
MTTCSSSLDGFFSSITLLLLRDRLGWLTMPEMHQQKGYSCVGFAWRGKRNHSTRQS